MKKILLILIALAGFLRADSEYIIEGVIEEITATGITVRCEPSDRIGYKRSIGPSIVEGHPDAARLKVGGTLKCFAWITGKGIENGGAPVFRFSRRR